VVEQIRALDIPQTTGHDVGAAADQRFARNASELKLEPDDHVCGIDNDVIRRRISMHRGVSPPSRSVGYLRESRPECIACTAPH